MDERAHPTRGLREKHMSYMVDGYYGEVAAAAPASERAAFIKRTYLHVAGAMGAFVALEAVLLGSGMAEQIVMDIFFANRRGWLIVLLAIPLCALLYRLLPQPISDSDAVEFFVFLPFVASIILATAFCNFTDRERRDGIAGFPRHLFVLPLGTGFLVTCAMACGLVSVLAVYIAWTNIVLPPLEIELWVRWPAILIGTCAVFYQAIIWCLCGFRLTRIAALSLLGLRVVAPPAGAPA